MEDFWTTVGQVEQSPNPTLAYTAAETPTHPRNDAIGNVAVLLAALGVFGTGTGWPDLIVATIMAALGISGGLQIVRQARGELRGTAPAAVPAE